jgi:multidrug efflux pump subunit AcrB
MIAFFTRHPTAANLLMISLIILGLKALPDIKRETFPEFTPLYVVASIVYPGASPQEVEESLCVRMEDAVDGLANIIEKRCEALEGSAKLTLKLNDKADLGRMTFDVQTQINAINDFPNEIESPIVQELNRNDKVVDIAISAPLPSPELKAYSESLKRKLQQDYDVDLVEVSGFSAHEFRIELDLHALRQMGLSVSDIANQVSLQNIKLPSGSIETDEKEFLIRFEGQSNRIETLANMVVGASPNGATIRLADVAIITDRFKFEEQKVLFDGQTSAIIKISKNKQEDALRVKEKVQRFVDDEQKVAPKGVVISLTNDMSSILIDRIQMMLKNGWQGIALVFLTLWLFFNIRYSFWVAAGLPVAFMGGLFLMATLGLSINMLSLVGLLMAIGIIMDDAIVIAESIASHIDRGQKINEAVINGVNKVMPGVVSSFLTTVCIFGGLLFLDGEMGAVLKAVPQVLLLVLSISLIEAFLILPNHLSHALQAEEKKKIKALKADGCEKEKNSIDRFKQSFIDSFESFRNNQLPKAVKFCVHYRYGFMGSLLALMLISISLLTSSLVRFTPFPELDGDIAEARIILAPGTTLKQTEKVMNVLVSAAQTVGAQFSEKFEEGAPLIQHITRQYGNNADAKEAGPHLATVRLDLLGAEQRNSIIGDVISAWKKEVGTLAEPISLVFKEPTLGPGGRDIELRIKHPDLASLKAVSIKIQQYLKQFDGASGIIDDMRMGKEEILVTVRPGAESHGINARMIASQLRAAFFGQRADQIQVGVENINVEVRLNQAQAGDLSQLANFPIINTDGSQIPLASLATLEFSRSYVRINRIDGLRSLSIYGDLDNSKISSFEIINDFKLKMMPELLKQYSELRFDFEGQAKDAAKTGKSMGQGFLIGLFGIFVILSFQFKSYLEPMMVMLAIPLAFIGVVWGHFLLGHSLSMPSMMGFVSLAGIVVNDSILLVQYIRHHLDEGDEIHHAVVMASRERFRAVFITSLTTAAGLLPLLLETSLQAQIIQPLVISIVFGIMASTALVLFMIPCMYVILSDFGLTRTYKQERAKNSVY